MAKRWAKTSYPLNKSYCPLAVEIRGHLKKVARRVDLGVLVTTLCCGKGIFCEVDVLQILGAVRNSDDPVTPYGDQAWEFYHPKFHCDKRNQLDDIKRKTPSNRRNVPIPSPTELPTNVHITELQSQINNLTKLQTSMNDHLHSLSQNYYSVIQDLLNFQKNMVAQDQLMQNLQTQKLINSYTEVSRASFEQMNAISRRAQSMHQMVSGAVGGNGNSSPEPAKISLSETPIDYNDGPSLGDEKLSNSKDNNNLGHLEDAYILPTETSSISPRVQPQTDAFQLALSNDYMRSRPDQILNAQMSNDRLTVLTMGQLMPRQSQSLASNLTPSASTNVTCVKKTSPSQGSNTMRVVRNTFVPNWSVPPKVLLVDDDAVYQSLGSKLLRIFGCSIDIAVDGISAVGKMNLEKYDLVLMDIVLPNLDGVEATTQIRRFDPKTPIISMTSNITTQECIKYLSHGMNDILAKPFTKTMLLAMLERYCMHLKIIPTFQNIPRSLGALDQQAETIAPSENGGGNNNDHNSWTSDRVHVSNAPTLTIMRSNENYVQMTNELAVTRGVTRYAEESEIDNGSRKKQRFEWIE
ncbi:6446_t:CDS:2 [Acaulospora colombiana]|uniref:6446_t:CDS:1 n=1 Tax=Acaulospora colombiana TaxID=27376 RepID=A0ACA9K8I6_9GLOM|nr:6446_t:CDS:2 [Acaulospora colombiana]